MATPSAAVEDNKAEKEGTQLLGSPTFTELQNGRFKCVETGHEMLAKDMDPYSRSKRCRLGLIDFALAGNKPPLNMFKQDPLCRSKLVCKLTGDTVNKSEEHIWKHINGKRFLNKLEQKEMEKLVQNDLTEEVDEEPKKASKQKKDNLDKKQKKEKQKSTSEIISEVRDSAENNSDIEDADFWLPPVGDRWDFDDGGDRWGSDAESGQDSDEEADGTDCRCSSNFLLKNFAIFS
ncbi:hypothetical protein BT93_B0484 [Corymbia citriodora subsp. variegata]|nr:hypothetical protein BT93_B0484 [Corymbia citriodora subsp. variegata]